MGLWVATVSCSPASRSTAVSPRAQFSEPEIKSYVGSRLRRLSNAEFEATVNALLARSGRVADRLPPDLKIDGYTRTGSAPVSSAYNTRLKAVTEELAAEFVKAGPRDLKCDEMESKESKESKDPAERACVEAFLSRFAERALRRPVTEEEMLRLLGIYEQARGVEGELEAALTWVVAALLQAPSFLYVSEEGEPTAEPQVRVLGQYELASVLSYTLRGAPPDAPLLEAAEAGLLLSPEEREAHARRLLSLSDTRHQFRRFVHEWLEVDELLATSKDESVTPYYEELKPRMLAETSAFVDEVMVRRGASLTSLLTAGFSSVDETMARFYGLDAWGPRVPSEKVGRLGLLQHASFLSAHAHPDGSSPVKRGDFVLRRILCVDMPRPDEIGIEVVIPPVTETQTTRERFSAHVSNKGCASCHDLIDPLGFAFEDFDAAGHFRAKENGVKVVTAGKFELEDYRATFSNSAELSRSLAKRPEAARCFRRHAVRYFAADESPAHAEAFEALSAELSPEARASLLENLVAYVRSDLFLYRRAQL